MDTTQGIGDASRRLTVVAVGLTLAVMATVGLFTFGYEWLAAVPRALSLLGVVDGTRMLLGVPGFVSATAPTLAVVAWLVVAPRLWPEAASWRRRTLAVLAPPLVAAVIVGALVARSLPTPAHLDVARAEVSAR